MNLNLQRNSLWATTEVIISGLSLFVLFKIVVHVLGVKSLGVWSLVLATTSLARLGDIGAAAGLSRFIAMARARGDEKKAIHYADTAFLANLGLYCAFGAILYLPLNYGLSLVVPAEALDQARSLLPYAIFSLIFLNLNGVMLSSLVGVHRTDLKSQIVIASIFVQIAVVAAFVSSAGLIAMAWGQIAQYCFAGLACRILFLRIASPKTSLLTPLKFDRDAFKEMVGFGLKLQAANLVSFVFEPIMKFCISSTGGLQTLGIFEMAYRMVLQVRHVVVAPTQALLPVFAHLDHTDPAALRGLFERALTATLLGGGVLLAGLAAASPFIGWIWLGHIDPLFVLFSVACCFGWFFNLAGTPAYLLGVSRGFIRWNIAGHIVTSFVGPLAGFIAFHAIGGAGTAVIASMAGLAAGAVLSWVLNCRQFGMPAFPSAHSFSKEIRFVLKTVADKIRRGS